MWSLSYHNTQKTFSEWSLSQLTIKRSNQIADTVSFKQFANIATPFEPGESLTIFREGSPWFTGIITQCPLTASSQESSIHYTVKGPWWYLDNLVFQQIWLQATNPDEDTPTLSPVSKGHLILGQNIDGNAMSIQDQIIEILQYAIHAGAPFQIGTIQAPFSIPFDEIKDISCSEAIQRLLRWVPDAISYFDYTTTPPTLHIKRRLSMPTFTCSIHQTNITQYSITPRYDLQVPSVILKYEKNHKLGNHTYSTTHIDSYPPHATGQEFKSMVLTIDMAGSQTTQIKQKIVTQPIHPHHPEWWKLHIPALNTIPLESIHINNITRSSDLSNELIEGSIAPWMNVEVATDTITASISYETDSLKVTNQPIAIQLTVTNAPSKTYRKLVTSSPAEDTPTDLAKTIYDSLNTLQFQGKISFFSKESLHLLGNTFNINDGQPAWKTMHALIQEVYEDCTLNTFTLHFGPPKHLGATDLVELLRLNRRRYLSRNAHNRTQGHLDKHNAIEQATHTRLHNGSTTQGQLQKLIFKDPQNPESSIILDTTPLPPTVHVELRSEYVCENGSLKQRFTLCSEPLNLEPEE